MKKKDLNEVIEDISQYMSKNHKIKKVTIEGEQTNILIENATDGKEKD